MWPVADDGEARGEVKQGFVQNVTTTHTIFLWKACIAFNVICGGRCGLLGGRCWVNPVSPVSKKTVALTANICHSLPRE